jgi:hypothetical protein
MLGMLRSLFAVALIALGLAGVSVAGAGDLVGRNSNGHFTGYGQRAGLVWIYDYEPGIVVRSYWATPWRHRHYFPATGEKPESGRLEDLSARGGASEPAETFQRFWSTSSAFLPELPGDPDGQGPPTEPPLRTPLK